MDLLIEFIFEFVFEIGSSASKNKKIPKPIRYLIILILAIFFVTIISVFYFVAFLLYKKHLLASILCISNFNINNINIKI